MVTITKETIIGDILDIAPQTAPLFMAIGMHCLGCPASRGETVEEAAWCMASIRKNCWKNSTSRSQPVMYSNPVFSNCSPCDSAVQKVVPRRGNFCFGNTRTKLVRKIAVRRSLCGVAFS